MLFVWLVCLGAAITGVGAFCYDRGRNDARRELHQLRMELDRLAPARVQAEVVESHRKKVIEIERSIARYETTLGGTERRIQDRTALLVSCPIDSERPGMQRALGLLHGQEARRQARRTR